MGGGGIVDGAGADDDQQALILTDRMVSTWRRASSRFWAMVSVNLGRRAPARWGDQGLQATGAQFIGVNGHTTQFSSG